MSDEIVDNLKKQSAWLRVLFMAGFVVALYVTGVVLLVIMLAQIIFSLFSGSDNQNLRRLGAGLASYVSQILAYLTYNSESRPFPFSSFPQEPAAESASESEKTPGPEAASEPEPEPEPKSQPEPTSEPEPAAKIKSEPEPQPEAEEAPSGAAASGKKPATPKKTVTAKKTSPTKKAAAGKKTTASPKPASRKPRTSSKSAKKTEGDGDS